MLNNKKSLIQDKELQVYLHTKELDLIVTTNSEELYGNADFVIVFTPTNYNPKKNYFDISSVEAVIKQVLEVNNKAYIVVKSTIPVGFTEKCRRNLIPEESINYNTWYASFFRFLYQDEGIKI